VVRLMGSAGGGRNPRDRMGGRGVRAWGGPRSGGQTHVEAGVRRGADAGNRKREACGRAGMRGGGGRCTTNDASSFYLTFILFRSRDCKLTCKAPMLLRLRK
jgi:hypothetical protein